VPGSAHRVTIMTRASCPGCREVVAEVARICAETGASWAAVDVDTDAELRARYGDRVPVLLVDGVEIGFWTVPEDELRAALAGR
jgi:glutaredoxin